MRMGSGICLTVLAAMAGGAGAHGDSFGGLGRSSGLGGFDERLLADADARVWTPGSASYGSGFRIDSADEAFSLRTNGLVQFRYFNAFEANATDSNYVNGFQFRRAGLQFRGHIGTPDLTFRFQTEFGRRDGVLDLIDGFFRKSFDNGFAIRVGQGKLPFDREFTVVSGTTPQMLDRSVKSDVFRLDRSQGIQFEYRNDRVRIHAMVSDGRRATNTSFTSPNEADVGLTARAELKLGDAGWSEYGDLVSFRTDDTGALFGAGLHWQDGGNTLAPDEGGQLFAYTADAAYEGAGWSVLAAVTGRIIEENDDEWHDYALLLQGGVFVTEDTEISGRVSYIVPDGDRTGGSDPFPEFAIATTYYIIPDSHAFKVTVQIGWLPEPQADSASIVSAPNGSVGFGADDSGGQFLLGLGAQIRF